jgi:hypothetical protein
VAGIATRCKSRILEWRNEVILWRCTDKSVIASRRVRDDHFGKVDMKAVGCLQGDRQLAKFQRKGIIQRCEALHNACANEGKLPEKNRDDDTYACMDKRRK